jgi:hypothetical protein
MHVYFLFIDMRTSTNTYCIYARRRTYRCTHIYVYLHTIRAKKLTHGGTHIHTNSGPDLVVDILRHERERQLEINATQQTVNNFELSHSRICENNAAPAFFLQGQDSRTHSDLAKTPGKRFLSHFATNHKEATTRQIKLQNEARQVCV